MNRNPLLPCVLTLLLSLAPPMVYAQEDESPPDIGSFLNAQQTKGLAVFESTLERWARLDKAQRRDIRRGYENHLGVASQNFKSADRAIKNRAGETIEQLGEEVENLSEVKKEYGTKVNQLEKNRQTDIARQYDKWDLWLHGSAYERAEARSAAQRAAGQYNSFTESSRNYHRNRVNQELDAGDARADVVDKAYKAEYDATTNAYRIKAKQQKRAIANLEAETRRLDGVKMMNDQNRAKTYAIEGGFLQRIYGMDEALDADYTPFLQTRTIDQFTGTGAQEFPLFEITSGLWRIEWELTGWSSPQDKVTIHICDGDTQRPFTAVNSNDPYLESFKILDETGFFFLKTTARGNPQFRIRVTEYPR